MITLTSNHSFKNHKYMTLFLSCFNAVIKTKKLKMCEDYSNYLCGFAVL